MKTIQILLVMVIQIVKNCCNHMSGNLLLTTHGHSFLDSLYGQPSPNFLMYFNEAIMVFLTLILCGGDPHTCKWYPQVRVHLCAKLYTVCIRIHVHAHCSSIHALHVWKFWAFFHIWSIDGSKCSNLWVNTQKLHQNIY